MPFGFVSRSPSLVFFASSFLTAGFVVAACSSKTDEPVTPVPTATATATATATTTGTTAKPDASPPPMDAAADTVGPIPDAAVPCATTKTCAVGAACASDGECASKNCIDNLCKAAACDNGKIDGDELGRDCGGTCRKCDGAACKLQTDCKSEICLDGKCAPSGTKTCGIGLSDICQKGAVCDLDGDCSTDYCSPGTAAAACADPPADVHSDGRRNGGETGVDCGGASQKECAAGELCISDRDCISTCGAAKRCNVPSATDGKKNNGETDIDCGGPNAPACERGKACVASADCKLNFCSMGTCTAPSATDGIKNGNETDVDCGGATAVEGAFSYTAPRCKFDRTCDIAADCVQAACSPSKKCVAPSCSTTETSGIVTCGTGEPGDPAAAHQSCCRSLPLPTKPGRSLDKYEITAGRFRSFINAVGPNVQAWVANYKAQKPASQLGQLATPDVLKLYPSQLQGTALNLVAQLATDIDNYSGIRGCYNGNGSSGHNTYWQEAALLANYGIPPRPLAREITDAKSMNCAPATLFAAFCAWDGGEMATVSDFQDAWGPAPAPGKEAFPWGTDDIFRPNYNWCNGLKGTGGWQCQDTNLGQGGRFYQFPMNTDQLADQSPLIAGPGRFPMDKTARTSANGESWFDLFGNIAEYTGDFAPSTADFCDFSAAPLPGAPTCTRGLRTGLIGTLYSNVPRAGIAGRSWEGHNYARGTTSGFAVMFQYGKFGSRCVRPTQ
jgi:hypothetical protein